ncbi:PREDICTED: tubulin glycylase 3A-like isoform X2 [Dinoponera quadriceps]|uniref:Tubulin glycylase 3A-like isoform X2 n=1 Tax=Dinoponera quadriceps TaxID=609295 RepID=A0A6P3YC32_DINQU|nr:PREDICTED: tubulin glycylase 3A-like isoform X2 [Dinoponera quadriceps]
MTPRLENCEFEWKMHCDDNNNVVSCADSKSKWQITVISKNYTIKKHFEDWQISPKSDAGKDSRLTETTPKLKIDLQRAFEKRATVNAEVCCNREDLDELLEAEKNEADHNGNIVLKKYLELTTDVEVRTSFLLRILMKAVNEHKCYVIHGVFPALKKPLANRGWIEKRAIRKMILIPDIYTDSSEQIEKLLRTPADFIWYTNRRLAVIRAGERTIVNKFAGSYFTSKVDMCNNLENAYWFYEDGVSCIHFPRCYNIYQPAQVEEFVQDYYITACMGILKWFLLFATLVGTTNICSPNGTIPVSAISFALDRCAEYIRLHTTSRKTKYTVNTLYKIFSHSVQMHEDIDHKEREHVSLATWHQFLDWFDKIINKRALLEKSDEIDTNELVRLAHHVMITITKYRAQSRIDGVRNIWILKPGDNSLGRGIILKNSLVDILAKINQATKESTQYVIQKYIERPLLVHKTKIDIRQWFLITNMQPLIVWMYKYGIFNPVNVVFALFSRICGNYVFFFSTRDILIRFASKDFTLSNFHESIHLCNTTVQLKYRKLPRRNPDIPKELHWNLQDFKDYLQSRDQELAWEKTIEPGIKQNLIGTLLASQDNMMNRKNSFQLYGADFVVADDFSVWLLEINTNPRLHPPSSQVTAKLYPEVIEDAMKVVLDCRKDKTALQGRFERIYKQRNPLCSVNVLGQGTSLGIRGKGLFAAPKSPPRSSF